MDNIKIEGSDARCVISGDGFSYIFIDGHPAVLIKDGKELSAPDFPEHRGRKMKSRAKLVHKYWDSALVITSYTAGLKKTNVRYHVFPDGELKREYVY